MSAPADRPRPHDLEAVERLQQRLAAAVLVPDGFELRPDQRVLGLDVQYTEGWAHVGAVLAAADGRPSMTVTGRVPASAPYVPGLFASREGPALLALVRRLERDGRLEDAVLLLDGHGVAHPRRFGLACWLGLAADRPAAGCAKRPLLPLVGRVGFGRGSRLAVRLDEELVGYALRTRNGVRPVYVSPGHRISVEATRRLVIRACDRFRLPEPLRRADHAARMAARGRPERGCEDLGELAPAEPPWDEPALGDPSS